MKITAFVSHRRPIQSDKDPDGVMAGNWIGLRSSTLVPGSHHQHVLTI